MRRRTKIAAGVITATLLLAGCGATTLEAASTSTPTAVVSTAATVETTSTVSSTVEGVDVDWSTLPTTEVTLTDAGTTITAAGTYVLSGSTTGQVVVNSDGAVRLLLNGVTIASSAGAAIQVDGAELTVIELAEGSTNTVSDAATRSDESIDGAIYSSDDLYITGSGSLSVTSNFADAIATMSGLTRPSSVGPHPLKSSIAAAPGARAPSTTASAEKTR